MFCHFVSHLVLSSSAKEEKEREREREGKARPLKWRRDCMEWSGDMDKFITSSLTHLERLFIRFITMQVPEYEEYPKPLFILGPCHFFTSLVDALSLHNNRRWSQWKDWETEKAPGLLHYSQCDDCSNTKVWANTSLRDPFCHLTNCDWLESQRLSPLEGRKWRRIMAKRKSKKGSVSAESH